MAVTVILENCKGCGVCEALCPAEAITLVKGKAMIDSEICTECATCVNNCRTEALLLSDTH